MVETHEDMSIWIDFLHTLSKDELINFIINDSFDEIRTAELLQLRFGNRALGSEVDQLIADYRSYVEACAYCDVPDVNHIVRMTRILIDLADNGAADERSRILSEVRSVMESLYENGVGMENDDDYIFSMIGEQVEEGISD